MNSQKVAVVTGAGSGVGKQTSIALLEAGYCVVLAGRTLDRLQQVADESRHVGERAMAVVTDVKDPDSVGKLFTRVAQEYRRLDLLFNNAGIFTPATPLEDLSFEAWMEAVNTNLTGAFLCTQHAFRVMKSQQPRGGRIINNGSISAQSPRPDSVAYTATKHAITGLTKCTALDGRKYDIACGQIDIGNAATALASQFAKGVRQANGEIMAEPTMPIEDVASAVVYMDSLSLDSNVQFMTIMATKMPFIGRG